VMMNLTAETRLEAGDDLLMLGHRSDIQRIEELN